MTLRQRYLELKCIILKHYWKRGWELIDIAFEFGDWYVEERRERRCWRCGRIERELRLPDAEEAK